MNKILVKKIKYRMWLVFVFEVIRLILGKSIFTAYKKLINLFPIYKNVNKILSKKTKKGFKKICESTKILLKKIKTKSTNMLVSDIEIFLTRK